MSKYIVQVGPNQDVNAVCQQISMAVIDGTDPPGQYIFQHSDTKRTLKVLTFTSPHSRTEQSYGEQLDINNIIEPAIRKGLLRHSLKFEGEYDDIPAADFQEAMNTVAKGKSMFEALPAKIRVKFDGDPVKFMEFVQNPENEAWMRENGMLKGLDGLDKDGKITDQKKAMDAREEERKAAAVAQDKKADEHAAEK